MRVLRRTAEYPLGSHDYFTVQKWLRVGGGWEDVINFQADQYDLACQYSMTLSMRKESEITKAEFEDGARVPWSAENCAAPVPDVHSDASPP